MASVAIIYYSNTGFSEKYANMIAKRVNGDLFLAKKLKDLRPVLKYDTIVYVGSVTAGRLNGFKVVDKNIYDIEDKHILLVAVGLTPQLEPVRQEYARNNIPFGFEDKIHFYQLRGGMAYDKYHFANKVLLNGIVKRLEKQPTRSAVEEEMLQAIKNGADYVSEEQIEPIVQEILHPTPIVIKTEEGGNQE